MWPRRLSMRQALVSAAAGVTQPRSLSMRSCLEAGWAGAGAAACTAEGAHCALQLLLDACAVVWCGRQHCSPSFCFNVQQMRKGCAKCCVELVKQLNLSARCQQIFAALAHLTLHILLCRLYDQEVAVKGNSRDVVQCLQHGGKLLAGVLVALGRLATA